MYLGLYNVLLYKKRSDIFQNVRRSKDVIGHRNFGFPGRGLLEIRPSGTVIGYKFKGCRKARR